MAVNFSHGDSELKQAKAEASIFVKVRLRAEHHHFTAQTGQESDRLA